MFFIFDCNNDIVGNPKGYKTHRGAQTQCNLDKSKPTKTMAFLWDRFHARAQIDPTKTRIYSIRWVDQQTPPNPYVDRGLECRSTPIRQLPQFAGWTDAQIEKYLDQ
jgi:hypothetical protein